MRVRYNSKIKPFFFVMILFLLITAPAVQLLYAMNGQPDYPTPKSANKKQATRALILDYRNAINEAQLDLLDMNKQLDWVKLQQLRLKDNHVAIPPKLSRTQKYLEEKIKLKKMALQRLNDRFNADVPHNERLAFERSIHSNAFSSKPPQQNRLLLQFPNTDQLTNEPPFSEQPISEGQRPEDQAPPDEQSVNQLRSELEQKMSQMELNEWLDIFSSNGHLALYVKWPIVFEADKISLSDHYINFLDKLANFLAPYKHIKIHLEGFSSTKKIGNQTFASNWELAMHRAIFVANQLIDKGVPSDVFNLNSEGKKATDYYNYTKLDSASKRRVEMTIFF